MERQLKHPESSAVALVLVLGMLALLSIVVVAFLTDVRTDLTASRSYEDQATTRELADSTVNLVIAQIREASTQSAKPWISQPGLIRTFAGASPEKAYKLYSDDVMQESGPFDPAAPANQPPLDWHTKPNLYTDLNAPVFKASTAVFPILDGNGIQTTAVAGKSTLIYDSDGNGQSDIDGFSIDPSGVSYQPSEPLSTRNNPVAMPVKWLYVLKDGTFVSGAAGTGPDAKIGGSTGPTPSKRNPIVSRVAFWTDDETAKVNINTASEGTYWDTPVANSQANAAATSDPVTRTFEWSLASRQGSQREYQRYPGHPATTCLSPIFGSSLIGLSRSDLVKTLTSWTPRVSDDGQSSEGGMRHATGIVKPDADRLYATADELLFDALPPGENGPSRGTHALPSVADSRPIFERARFFLTANSRAPEQNLFNKPRVAIWPIHATADKRTAFDRLFAFCATVGGENGRAFYFTRENPASPTVDWSARNAAIYAYLQKLTDQPFPGFGGDSFQTKYGNDRDQILTEIFEYIRCTNLADTSEGAAKSYTPAAAADPVTKRGQVVPIEPGNGTRGFGRIATLSELGLVLIKVDDRNSAMSGPAAKIFYTAPAPLSTGVCLPLTETLLEWALLPKLNSPMAGYSGLANDLRFKFTNVNLTVGGQTASGSAFPDLYDTGRLGGNTHDSKIGGSVGLSSLFEAKDSRNPTNPGAPTDSMFPTGLVKVTGTSGMPITVSGTVDLEIWAPAVNGTKLQTIQVNIPATQVPIPGISDYAASTSTANRWMGTFRAYARQAFSNSTVTFTYNNDPKAKTSSRVGQQFQIAAGGAGALYRTRFLSTDAEGQTEDTIRSMSPTGPIGSTGSSINGDMRLVAMTKNITTNTFELSKKSDASAAAATDKQVHSLRSGARKMFGSAGRLFARGSAQPDYVSAPDVPSGVQTTGGAGDWDNGPGLLLDGALLNKADEGSGIRNATDVPYLQDLFYAENSSATTATFFSPNRQLPSAVMFGSLPTGVKSGKAWRTLLFRPALLTGSLHPGGGLSADHLLLDLFWMPIVEPYPISEPFATAGKINLNYQIAPFGYIKRDTGMRAVMKSVMITALNPDQNNYIQTYKNGGSGVGAGVVTRRGIDLNSTLRQIDDLRFKAGVNKPFIAASEVCDIPLVPSDAPGQTNAGIAATDTAQMMQTKLATFWSKHQLTGDNSLERPYAHIYPRVTTRSNSYTVHVRVQSLKKITADPDQDIFKEARDLITGEFRGSFVIERYLDPNAQQFDESDPNAVLGPYRFRVVSSKQFGL
jgi:uncharacterized protein (TIGR02600 family)